MLAEPGERHRRRRRGGTSHPARADADGLGARLAEAFGKYPDAGCSPGADAWADDGGGGLRVLLPRRALAWSAFPTDATRFDFPA